VLGFVDDLIIRSCLGDPFMCKEGSKKVAFLQHLPVR